MRILRPAPFFGSGLTRIKNIFLTRRNRLSNATRGLAPAERKAYSKVNLLGAFSRETSERGQEVKSRFWARHIIAKNLIASRAKVRRTGEKLANAQESSTKAKSELARQREFGRTLPVTKKNDFLGMDLPMGKLGLRKRFKARN